MVVVGCGTEGRPRAHRPAREAEDQRGLRDEQEQQRLAAWEASDERACAVPTTESEAQRCLQRCEARLSQEEEKYASTDLGSAPISGGERVALALGGLSRQPGEQNAAENNIRRRQDPPCANVA